MTLEHPTPNGDRLVKSRTQNVPFGGDTVHAIAQYRLMLGPLEGPWVVWQVCFADPGLSFVPQGSI